MWFELLEHPEAVQTGHSEIEEDKVGQKLLDDGLCLAGVADPPDLGIASAFQNALQQGDVRRLVVDDEDATASGAGSPGRVR